VEVELAGYFFIAADGEIYKVLNGKKTPLPPEEPPVRREKPADEVEEVSRTED